MTCRRTLDQFNEPVQYHSLSWELHAVDLLHTTKSVPQTSAGMRFLRSCCRPSACAVQTWQQTQKVMALGQCGTHEPIQPQASPAVMGFLYCLCWQRAKPLNFGAPPTSTYQVMGR